MSTETEDRLRRINSAQAAKMAEQRATIASQRLKIKKLEDKLDDLDRRRRYQHSAPSISAVPPAGGARAKARW